MYTFPYSPLPVNMSRNPDFGGEEWIYDSGAYQAVTPWTRPMWRYNISIKLMTDSMQSALNTFWIANKGRTNAFLFKDPYDFRINSSTAVPLSPFSGINSNFYIRDVRSNIVLADTTTIGSLAVINGTTNSPYILLGQHFVYSQDTGIGTILVKHVSDEWYVRSVQFFRKGKFDSDYVESSPLWGIYTVQNLSFREVA